jgi:hypothetical protein
VQQNEVVGPGQVIGGAASDATSGVGRIEVSINDGDWQPAEGAHSWAFSLAGQSGAIGVRVRAVDQVGNVGAPSAPLALVVDAVAPAVTLNAPAGTIKPAKNGSGVWQVNLTGTASDAGGVEPGSLRVRLEQHSGVGVAQTAQPAALSGAAWSIDYLLDAGLYDPTGSYTVTVEAVDVVGNRAAPATAVLRLDARGPNAALNNADVARQAISQAITIGGVISDTDSSAGIDRLEIAFTPLEQIASLPPGLTGEQAEAQLNRTWTPVALAQRGPGVATATWSYQIPSGLENLYQLDLRGTDVLGNVAISANLWRGEIDTTGPRVLMTATPTGASYVDAGGRQRHAVRFVCAAVDRNLDEAAFDCPGESVAEPTRTFDAIPQLQALFPDLTVRSGLAVSYTLWVGSSTPGAILRACDAYGHCAQASASPALTDGGQPPAAPKAVIVAPTEGDFVAAGNAMSVTVAAEAGALLKTVTIRLDGAVVQTLDFGQSEAVTRTQRTVGIAIANEGPHTLVAEAIDWGGASRAALFPVNFTLDMTAPSVAIDAGALTNADTWQPQSGILRLSGTASDSVGLAAVKVRVDDGEFADATFGSGVWRTALFVPDPEGRTLAVTVRASDRAGRITEVTQQIATELSAGDAPDTTIAGGPGNPTDANSASFVFVGSANAVVYECQLDDGAYLPCASPQQYNDLSKGSHVFRVRAIDSRGFADLSPATFAWTVNASQPDVTLTGKPANPTTEHGATFTFSGDATATAFECSLDGGAYAPCSSPRAYGDLGNGEHTFRVRARDAANKAGAAERYTWTVNNAPPVAADQSVTVPMNQTAEITLAATDHEPLVFSVATLPAHGVLTGAAPNLSYTPDTNYAGGDGFSFSVSDGQGGVQTATVTITVSGVADQAQYYLPLIAR